MESALVRWLKACMLLLAVAGGLSLPLVDILTYPNRLSVLPSLQVDAATYDAIGQSLAATGRVSDIPARQPPGFVVLLALAYSAFGSSWVTAKMVLWFALGITVLAGWLGRRVSGSGAGVVAALLTATAPALRHYVGTIQYEIATAAGVLVLLALATRAVDAGSRANAVLWTVSAGLVGGLLALTREVFVGVLPIVAAWLATRLGFRFGPRLAVACAAVFLLIAAAPVALWSIAQFRAHGQLVVISDKGPRLLRLEITQRRPEPQC